MITVILVFLFVTLPLQLVGALVLPVVLLFVPADQNVLPNAFKWFDNAEIPLAIGSQDDGLSGPASYSNEMVSKYGLYLTRYIWLAWRNPINYFQYKVLGIHINDTFKIIDASEYNDNVGNKEGNVTGVSKSTISNDGKTYFEYYRVIKLWSTRCLRIRLGWKISNPVDVEQGSYIQYVCTFNLAEYEGN